MRRVLPTRLCALVLLAGFALSGAAGLRHIVESDDLPVRHDAAAHRWGADRPARPSTGDRCALCQWLRLVSSPPDAAGRLLFDPTGSGRLWPLDALATDLQRALQLPARSPPATSVTPTL